MIIFLGWQYLFEHFQVSSVILFENLKITLLNALKIKHRRRRMGF